MLYKEISDSEVKRISEKYNVSPATINEILVEWAIYLHMQDDLPLSSDPADVEERTRDWAQLSLFFHENKSSLGKENPLIFKEATFKSTKSNKGLKLSSYFANHIISTFLKTSIKKSKLFDKATAEKILAEKPKVGKRRSNTTLVQDELIMIAYAGLSSEKVKSYSPLVKELLSKSKVAELSEEAIRQTVYREKT
jgi:hypothetical protein